MKRTNYAGLFRSAFARDIGILLVLAAASAWFGSATPRWMVYAALLAIVASHQVQAVLDAERAAEREQWMGVVDPWAFQRRLMAVSGQRMCASPRLTNEVLLYAALVMEEAGETFDAVNKALWENAARTGNEALIAHSFRNVGRDCGLVSTSIRNRLKLVTIDEALSRDRAGELLDGVTDVVVVACGLSLAAGLPGAAAYMEVAESNLSKANPKTGKIEKTPDGKWIKGPNYRQPDLGRVLDRHAG